MQPQHCALDETRTARDSRITETLPLPGIILGIGVREPPRPNRLDLNNRLAPSPHKMAGSLRDDDEASRRHGLGGLYIELGFNAGRKPSSNGEGQFVNQRIEAAWLVRRGRPRHLGRRFHSRAGAVHGALRGLETVLSLAGRGDAGGSADGVQVERPSTVPRLQETRLADGRLSDLCPQALPGR